MDASDQPTREADFDSVRMRGRFGEDALNNPTREFARALVLLEDDEDGEAGFEGGADGRRH